MMLGLYAEGKKSSVIISLVSQVAEQKDKFQKDCEEVQTVVYGEGGKIVRHEPNPLAYQESLYLIDQAFKAIQEQLNHVKDGDDVAVSFALTVHRPNPGQV